MYSTWEVAELSQNDKNKKTFRTAKHDAKRDGHAKIRTWDLRLIRALGRPSHWYVFLGVVFHRLSPFFTMFNRFRGMNFLEIFARLEIAKNCQKLAKTVKNWQVLPSFWYDF